MPTCLLLPPNDRQAGAAPALPSHYLRPWAGSSSAHVPICLRPSVQPGRTTGTAAAAAATTESNPRVSQDEQSRPSITTPPPASPLNLLPQRRYYSPSAAAIPKANLLLAQQLLLGVHRANERCRSDGSQASELGETVLMFHVALAQCCCCTLLHCTLLHNAPLFLSSVAQICPMQGGKKKGKKDRKKDSTFLLLSSSISQRAGCSHRRLAGRPLVSRRLYGGCFALVNWAVPLRAHVILGTA